MIIPQPEEISPSKVQPLDVVLFLLSGFGYVWLVYFVDRQSFVQVLSGFGALFVCYLLLYKYRSTKIEMLILWGLFFRGLLLFALPNLSDDFYRFLWDGEMINMGMNPFRHLPSELMSNSTDFASTHQALFENLNSPEYYTIYPPILQVIFALSVFLFPSGPLWANVAVMKLIVLLAEWISIVLIGKILHKLRFPRKGVLLYALNPLVIVELTGNLHFEALMICFLLAAFYYLLQERNIRSALFFSLAVGAKLLPLMFLPLIMMKLGFRKAVRYYLRVALFTVLFFLPLWDVELLLNVWKSVNLYFQKFEFNASIYYIVRWVGYQLYDFNIIHAAGPWLSLVVLTGILLLSFNGRYSWKELFEKVVLTFTIYLLCATIVHPWYISLLIAFCVFTPLRFPMIWSAMVVLSYAAYQSDTYEENLWLVAIEYMVVIATLLWEIRKYYLLGLHLRR
ncbi:hypothetical protein AAG747_24900 [Rapidithrix thailandica]|uniref:Mannosyltransferase n=1 Tax=Rapidithrix thailandica TaxID=413964 RepID=A0AAW9SH99_9BACT